MPHKKRLTLFITLVWLINGLYCKILNGVPRHEAIVAEILNTPHSRVLTILIGISEVIMAIWIWSRWRSRENATLQILIVSTMNILEFLLVPHLLLWGKANALFALSFIAVVYYNEFILNTSKDAWFIP